MSVVSALQGELPQQARSLVRFAPVASQYHAVTDSSVGTVSPINTSRRTIQRLQYSRVRKATDTRCVPRTPEGRGFEANSRSDTEGIERTAHDEGEGRDHLRRTEATAAGPRACFSLMLQHADKPLQRQSVVSQFFELDRLVVETNISVREWFPNPFPAIC